MLLANGQLCNEVVVRVLLEHGEPVYLQALVSARDVIHATPAGTNG
jgi:hypothetical protein